MLVVGSSLFAVEAFGFGHTTGSQQSPELEVEIQKESDRIIESRGWLTPELYPFQEQLQLIVDQLNSKSRISIGILSTHPNDIKFPDYIEKISSNPRVLSFTLTNQFACSPNNTENGCVIIEIAREGLGDSIDEIKKNSREIADTVVERGAIISIVEFDSVTLEHKTGFDGTKRIVSKVLYTTNKQTSSTLFGTLATFLISSDIRDAGGFYDHAAKLSKHHFSDFTLSFVPLDKHVLRSIHVSLTCSAEQPELPDCPGNYDELLKSGEVSPLEALQVENINRSEMFADKFLPLNSIVRVLIFDEQGLQIKTINSGIIEKLEHLGNLQHNGWFFTSVSGEKIDGRYIFAAESSVSKNDLVFSIGDSTGEAITWGEKSEDDAGVNGGGCLIATAAFGSEMAPQVQFLRELRDNTVLQTQSGTSFMTGFNQFYYSFSPIVADYERENPTFKEIVKITLTPLLTSLTLLQYADIDSESEMLGYGIGIILLNIGMYFVAPAVLIMKVRKKIQNRK